MKKVKKKKNSSVTKVVARECTHRYPTRFSIRTALARSPFSQVSGTVHSQRLVSCKSTRKRALSNPPSCLPNDVIYVILLHLPAHALYHQVRYVCKEWYNIISDPTFANAHFRMSSPGILIHHRAQPTLLHYLHTSGNELKLTEFNIPFPGTVVSSCHGLVLIHDWTNPEVYKVVNLITKVKVSLPPIVGLRTKFLGIFAALSYASSGHYKAVHVSLCFTPDFSPKVMVCTVGTDKAWRYIDLPGKPMNGSRLRMFCHATRVIGGFIYWFEYAPSGLAFALDVDAERIYQLPTPECHKDDPGYSMYLEKGLGYVFKCHTRNSWVVWEMTGAKTGEWTKVLEMDIDDFKGRLKRMYPTWVVYRLRPLFYKKNGDFWFWVDLRITTALVCYNLRKGTFLRSIADTIRIADTIHCLDHPFPHFNTLLPLKNG